MNYEGEFRLEYEEGGKTRELVFANPIVDDGVNHIIDVDFDELENPFVVPNDHALSFSQIEPAWNLILDNGEQKAVIDFSGDEVTYSGDLPVDEAAKLFFDAVYGHMQ